jgi:hypothetical protein
VKFIREEVSVKETQDSLSVLFLGAPQLQTRFAPFLLAPLKSQEDQVEAKAQLCKLIGIPGTTPRDPNLPSDAESYAFLGDGEVRTE